MAKGRFCTHPHDISMLMLDTAVIISPNSPMGTHQQPQRHIFKATRPTLRPLAHRQAPVHNSAEAATEAVERFEVPDPAVAAVVADSKAGTGVQAATALGLLPVSRTM